MTRISDGVYQRGDYWYFKAKVKGLWIERATRTRVYTEARKIRTEFLKQVEAGKLPNERSRWTLQRAIEQRLRDRKLRIAAGSYASEAAITRTLMRVLGRDKRLSDLADLEVIHLFETVRLQEGRKAKTVNNEVLVLTGILRDAKLWHRLEGDYKPLQVQKSDIPDALSPDEAGQLMEVARRAPYDAVAPYAAVLSYSTGMRAGEIKRLRIGAIHLNSPTPQIQVKRATTKTNKGARFVALDQMACWALRKLLDRAALLGATRPEHCLLPTLLERHTRATDPLHGGKGYNLLHPQRSWDQEWDKVRKEASIEHRRFHDLRHSYITRAAEAGIPLMTIQSQVGHMSAVMVEHYCHISQAAVHKAARQIEQGSADLLKKLGLGLEVQESLVLHRPKTELLEQRREASTGEQHRSIRQ